MNDVNSPIRHAPSRVSIFSLRTKEQLGWSVHERTYDGSLLFPVIVSGSDSIFSSLNSGIQAHENKTTLNISWYQTFIYWWNWKIIWKMICCQFCQNDVISSMNLCRCLQRFWEGSCLACTLPEQWIWRHNLNLYASFHNSGNF